MLSKKYLDIKQFEYISHHIILLWLLIIQIYLFIINGNILCIFLNYLWSLNIVLYKIILYYIILQIPLYGYLGIYYYILPFNLNANNALSKDMQSTNQLKL